MAEIGKLHTRKLTKSMVMNISIGGTKELAARIFIGSKLIKLAAWIIGCQVEIDTVRTDPDAN